jgi:hypothetical protein
MLGVGYRTQGKRIKTISETHERSKLLRTWTDNPETRTVIRGLLPKRKGANIRMPATCECRTLPIL